MNITSVAIATLITTVVTTLPTRAQLLLEADTTLGREASQVNPVPDLPGFSLIQGGAQRGSNLFHSFQEFNVNEGGGVYFVNPSGIENIFSRVTGNHPSQIAGILGVLGDANLFLLNPNGVVFGSNASLDLRGSFLATTAEGFVFSDEDTFSAVNPQEPSLLSMNIPIGLQYGTTPGAIASQAVLVVDSGRSLALAGGDITLDGSYLAFRYPEGGQLSLAAVGGSGRLGLAVNGNTLGLAFPSNLARADIVLRNGSSVDARIDTIGGQITIVSRNLDITGGSQLLAGIGENRGSVTTQAGNLLLDTTGSITLSGEDSGITNIVSRGATGNAGNIQIRTNTFWILDGAQVSASTFGNGNAGNIVIDAADAVVLSGRNSSLLSNIESAARGDGGQITIATHALSLLNGGQIQTGIRGSVDLFPGGQGNSGSVNIRAADLDIVGRAGNFRSGVFNDTEPGSVGRSGNININVGNLRIFDGALLRTSSAGQGDGGNITVRAGTLDMRSGAELSSSTFGPGNAGNINLELSNWGYLEGGGTSLFSNIEAGAVGNGGQINLIAPGLALVNGAQIQAGIRGSFSSLLGGQGNAGRVTIQTQNLAIIGQDGELRSGIFNDAESGSAGRSGDIYIIAEAFRLSDGGILRSRNLGLGDGGDIVIATDVLEVLNESRLDTSIQRSGNTGNAGNVVILASDRVTFSNSNMFSTVEARAVGNSGNIIIDTRLLEVLDGSQLQVLVRGSAALAGVIQITASDRVIFAGISPDGQFPSGAFGSVEGRGVGVGGNINITTDVLEVRDGALLSVRSLSPTGVAGNLEITAREVRLNNGRLDAETEFSPQNVAGANISLRGLELLLMENDSLISARARSAANGGNISIDASNGFVIGIPNENNDIIATAEAGDGGNIIIRANRIFGFTDQTDAGFTFSQLRSNITSDISASSQFGTQGSVALDVIAIDPTQGLTALPDALVDVTNQIGQVCPTGPDAEDQLGSFIITGRGGIAPSPLDVMDGRAVDAGWVDSELDESGEAEAEDGDKGYGEAQTVAEAQTLTEAQRWVVDTDGQVHLVAGSHSASSPATIPARCPSPNRIVIER